MTQDCTVTPAHFQGTPYREPIPEDVSVLAHSTLPPQVGDQRDPSGKGSRCYRSRTSSASGYCRVVQCAR